MSRKTWSLAALVVAGIAAGVPVALGVGADPAVRVVAPEAATPGTVAPGAGSAASPSVGPAAGSGTGSPAIPAPVAPPPSVNGAAPNIGQQVDPASPPASSVPVPVPGRGVEVTSAQVNNAPIDTSKATDGVAFAARYYATWVYDGTTFAVAVFEPSKSSQGIPLTLGARSERLSGGQQVYAGPGETTAFPVRNAIVSITGGDDQQRQQIISGMSYR